MFDEWYESLMPNLERIDVPALVCASFSDHSLHSRGSFEAYRRMGSTHKWLYTHRGGKWSTYYGRDALETRLRFFDWALKGVDNGQNAKPPVRLEIRERGDSVYDVRSESTFPPDDIRWRRLFLDAASGRLTETRAESTAYSAFRRNARGASFSWTAEEDIEIVGPMALRAYIELQGSGDAHIFVGVRKFHGNVQVTFEGSYGFERDLVTKGWLVASHREANSVLSSPGMPVHTHRKKRPFAPGEVAAVDIPLLPSATLFRAGDVLRLDVQGHWFFPTDPVRGQFPARYESGPRCTTVVHTGGRHDAYLLVPVRPVGSRA
jgi:putative CocE/NonD family hydrolase